MEHGGLHGLGVRRMISRWGIACIEAKGNGDIKLAFVDRMVSSQAFRRDECHFSSFHGVSFGEILIRHDSCCRRVGIKQEMSDGSGGGIMAMA